MSSAILGEGPRKRRHQTATRLRNKSNVYSLLEDQSRFTVCTASDATLAKGLGLAPRSINSLLHELQEDGWIKIVTRFVKHPKRPNAERTIYLVQRDLPVEGGARMLATLIRDTGRVVTSLTDAKCCGQLQCTRRQLSAYRRFAVDHEWITFDTVLIDGVYKDRYQRIGSFEPLAPLRRRWTGKALTPIKKWLPAVPTQGKSPKEEEKDVLVKRVSAFHPMRHPCSMTNADLARELRCSEGWIKKLLSELLAEGRLFVKGKGRARRLMVVDPASLPNLPAADEARLWSLLEAHGSLKGRVPRPDDIDIATIAESFSMNVHMGQSVEQAEENSVTLAYESWEEREVAKEKAAKEKELDAVLASIPAVLRGLPVPRIRDELRDLDEAVARIYLRERRYPAHVSDFHRGIALQYAAEVSPEEKRSLLGECCSGDYPTQQELDEAARRLLGRFSVEL